MAIGLHPLKSKHTRKDITLLFYKSLKFYDLKHKVEGVTLDNASTNNTFMIELGRLMKAANIEFDVKKKKKFRCFSHILNLAAQKVLKLIKFNDINIDYDDKVTENDEKEPGHCYHFNCTVT